MFSRDTAHLWVLAGVLTAVAASYAAVRTLATPASWGQHGPYRGAALDEAKVRAVQLPTKQTCVGCHKAAHERLDGGAHKGLNCVACHGYAPAHLTDCQAAVAAAKAAGTAQDKVKCDSKGVRPLAVRATCEVCHRAMVGRPPKFPQIVVAEHLAEQQAKEPKSPKTCLQCHVPHAPGDEPELPEEGTATGAGTAPAQEDSDE